MSADTYDVFEYSQEHGGYAGVRTFRDHNDSHKNDPEVIATSGEFTSFESIDDSTLKNRIIKAVLKAFPDPLGNVGNLDSVEKRFLFTVVSTL